MKYSAVGAILQEKTGLNFKSVSEKSVDHIIHRRIMSCLKTDNEVGYLEIIKHDSREFDRLVDEMAVGTTWFFRDIESFKYFKKNIQNKFVGVKSKSSLNILSLACSTGEEPYSIAMILDELNLKHKFRIDAIDISEKNLRIAKKGLYRNNSFTHDSGIYTDTNSYINKYFVKSGNEYQLSEDVISQVNFIHGNIINQGILENNPYDYIFCKNVMIYLTKDAREKIIKTIHNNLVENGIVFLGNVESPFVFFPEYQPVEHARSFAAKKITTKKSLLNDSCTGKRLDSGKCEWTPLLPKRTNDSGKKKKNIEKGRKTAPEPVIESEDNAIKTDILLSEANILANNGELAKAVELCDIILKNNAFCVDAYYLLGVIYHADNNDKLSLEYLNKTLYLDSEHEMARMYLELIKKK